MKCVFSDFGVEIFKEKNRYFLRFDAGEIVSIMKNVELSPSEAGYIMREEDEKNIISFLSDNRIWDRSAILFEAKMNCVEKNFIRVLGHFLEKKGYTKKESDYNFLYTSPDIRICVGGEPNSTEVDIVITFVHAAVYRLSWIFLARKGKKIKTGDRVSTLIRLLDYLKRDYDLIINEQYCKDSMALVKEYLQTNY